MTRGNINFISQERGESPRTLFFYWNGDQYPSGLLEVYNVLELVSETITRERFTEWAEKNYDRPNVQDIDQPKIYYTDGYITDYSYVFEPEEVTVWEWEEVAFKGNREEFIKWIK